MSILKIRFGNIWHSLSIVAHDNHSGHLCPNTSELISWSKAELTNGIAYLSNPLKAQKAQSLADCDELILNFNPLSFIAMLTDDQKEMLIQQLAENVGFDKACSIIYEQEQYVTNREELGYE